MDKKKIAFLFPGQGAQTIGMGLDLPSRWPSAARLFEKASEILNYDVLKLCAEGPEDKLNSTVYSQPAIFVVSAALLEILRQERPSLTPQVAAGLSMGEYTALYAAGWLSFEEALRLVQKRGQAMQAAADASSGSMVSILGLDEEKVRQLCTQAAQGQVLEPVNFNCPGQIVVSGHKEACCRAEQLAGQMGAMKAVPLAVAGAFHTILMKPAAQQLSEALQQAAFQNPSQVKVIANINAEYYTSAQEIREGLVKQLVEPILWQKCMERLLREQITEFYEIGPGRVLTGLMKRIDRKAKVITVNSADAFAALPND
jgi:[acyl-carrier-protein] S-malonyltransferase